MARPSRLSRLDAARVVKYSPVPTLRRLRSSRPLFEHPPRERRENLTGIVGVAVAPAEVLAEATVAAVNPTMSPNWLGSSLRRASHVPVKSVQRRRLALLLSGGWPALQRVSVVGLLGLSPRMLKYILHEYAHNYSFLFAFDQLHLNQH